MSSFRTWDYIPWNTKAAEVGLWSYAPKSWLCFETKVSGSKNWHAGIWYGVLGSGTSYLGSGIRGRGEQVKLDLALWFDLILRFKIMIGSWISYGCMVFKRKSMARSKSEGLDRRWWSFIFYFGVLGFKALQFLFQGLQLSFIRKILIEREKRGRALKRVFYIKLNSLYFLCRGSIKDCVEKVLPVDIGRYIIGWIM